MTRICVSLGAPSLEELEEKMERALRMGADLLELRLDYLEDSSVDAVERLIAQYPGKVIATLRPAWEGGRYRGDEEERLETLARTARAGAAYVDLELNTRKLREAAERIRENCRLIVSWHNFRETPVMEVLREKASRAVEVGDVAKVVATARSLSLIHI